MTRAPIKKEKIPSQPVTTTVFPSAKVPALLSSIYVPRKPFPVTTNYIIPIFYIDGGEFYNSICSEYTFKIFETKIA